MTQDDYIEQLDRLFENSSYETVKWILSLYKNTRLDNELYCNQCSKRWHFHDCKREFHESDWSIEYVDEDVWGTNLVCDAYCPVCGKKLDSFVEKELGRNHLT